MLIRPRAVPTMIGIITALALTAVLLSVVGSNSRWDESRPAQEDALSARFASFTGQLNAKQPYRSPKSDERQRGEQGFSELLDSYLATSAGLAGLGFSVEDAVDTITGRTYTIAVGEPGTERAWGMYLIDRSAPPSLVIEVPHPASDLRTELLGLDYFRRSPGAILLVAGAHRKADDGHADVAHEENSLFHVIATSLAGRGLPQVQLHGFDDHSLPGKDVVLSAGAGRAGAPAKRAAEDLDAAGFAVCRAWAETCKELEGSTNVQGKAAAMDGTMFLHVEMSRTVRWDDRSRATVVEVLVKARLTDQ